jgi:carbamoyl-phosphate synthase large subunit
VATKQAVALPWQAAMSEVKKRRDIKKIMIIGAGPIVIGQVGRL